MKTFNAVIKDYGEIKINGILINEKIFNEELSDYKLIEREQQINDLITWIAETKSDSDKYIMKEDLLHLMKLNDEFIFSSISTNEFIAKSDNKRIFNKICKELLELSEELK
jgi:hypothetical protein